MKNFSNYPLKIKLSLVPSVAVVCFVAYLIYSVLVLSGGNDQLKEIRDIEFPILYAAGENIKSFEGLVESLNTAAATGEVDYLNISGAKSLEIIQRYESMEKIDNAHIVEIQRLISDFNAFYAVAFKVAQRMANKAEQPSYKQIQEMRDLRNTYSQAALKYRNIAENDFQEAIQRTIQRSDRALESGALIGMFMLVVIGVLTLLVNRGIVLLEEVVDNRNKMLLSVNSELEQEIRKLKEADEARIHAETASQIKDEFLANMSHELRTPMNAIIGLSHLCLQTEMTAKQNDYLQKVHGSAKSLLGILNDILDVSKIEAGKMELDRIPFELDEVLDNLSTILGAKSQEKNVELLLETSSNVPFELIGDPLRLGQILINLVGNAVKFTTNGEVLVRSELESEEADRVTLRFTVKDTGIGMTQSEIDKLFIPFTQADSSITRKFGGTGLGLTISKRLIEMMNGKISVESSPGLGSRFSFTADFIKANKKDSASQKEFDVPKGLRVIIVDADERSQSVLKSYLESFGFDVSIAGNEREAMRSLRIANKEDRPFRLAIIDLKLKDQDGAELARELRAMTDLSINPKILLVGRYGAKAVLSRDYDQIVDGILEKPILQGRLLHAIAKTFGLDGNSTGRYSSIGAQFNKAMISQVQGARLLLVEDNEINHQVAKELLESYGITVSIAEDGVEAIERINQEKFDGVLMDVQMPVMDGITATREIRKDPRFVNLPIIALTANVLVREQSEILAAGMNDHIGKPIDPDKLVATLARWIHPHRGMDDSFPVLKTESAAPESLPFIPGVNVEKSVRRLGGNLTLYFSLLKKFRDKELDTVGNIRDALASVDNGKAERLAHTLRGTAGNLGMESLHRQADLLEQNIKNGNFDNIELILQDVEVEIVNFANVIGLLLENEN